jgi:hypothetical protein
MAIISNFEILLNRIANAGDATLPSNAPFRRVVQGYFLTVSNPAVNNVPITFVLRFTVNFTNVTSVATLTDSNNAFCRSFVSSGAGPAALASSNHVLIVNKEPDNTLAAGIAPSVLTPGALFPAAAPTAQQFNSQNITIGVGQTFSIGLFPNTQNKFVLGPSELAIRGYVEIDSVPAPVNKSLIMSAEHRGTFLDNNYPTYSNEDMDFDQIAYALPMFGGGSKVGL